MSDNPYKFTVRVHYALGEWLVRLSEAGEDDSIAIAWFPSETEAREHAVLIVEALRNVETD